MEWLDKEIKLYINKEGPFNLYAINYCLKLCLLTPLMSPTPTPAILNNLPPTAKLPLPTNITAVLNNLPTAEPPLLINTTASPINVAAPSIKVTATINYGRDLATLAKIYIEESKYSREDDNFNRKLTIFNDLYNRVEIPQAAKIKGFLIILYSITLDFYYKNKATYTTFNNICNAIHNYFKGPEYKRGVLIKWNAITLKTLIIKNKGKSIEDCL